MGNLRRWSSSASGNSSVAGGANTINFAEGQAPGSVNNSAREMMAQVRGIYTPSEWGWVEFSATASVASQTTIKLTGNQTNDWTAGRRWRLKSASTTRYGSVVSSSFTAETTITVTVDSGSLSASHSLAALAAIDSNNIPTSARFDSIELGAASDTTISRSSAGVIAVEGGVIPKENRANTFSADQVINANVGIGTTPSAKFHVVGPSGGASGQFTDNVNSTLVIKHESGGLLTYEGVGSSIHRWVNNSLERMRVDAAGNVGIGGTPSARLHVNAGATDEVARLESTGQPFLSWYDSGVRDFFIQDTASAIALYGETSKSLTFHTNGTHRFTIDTTGDVLNVSSGGLGYGTGSGGTVTQITNKNTGVTINKTNGQIVTAAGNITAGTPANFVVTNSTVAATDTIIVHRASGGTASAYTIGCDSVAAGSFRVYIDNITAGSLNEVLTLNFAVIKAVTA